MHPGPFPVQARRSLVRACAIRSGLFPEHRCEMGGSQWLHSCPWMSSFLQSKSGDLTGLRPCRYNITLSRNPYRKCRPAPLPGPKTAVYSFGVMEPLQDWWADRATPMEILVQSGGGILTVAIKVPWFVKLNAIHSLNVRLHELFRAIGQMDGRAPSEIPVIQSRAPQDCDQ